MNATSYTTGIDHKKTKNKFTYPYTYRTHPHFFFKARTPKVDMHIYTQYIHTEPITPVVSDIRAACLYTSWRAADLVLATRNNSQNALLYTHIATRVKMKMGSLHYCDQEQHTHTHLHTFSIYITL